VVANKQIGKGFIIAGFIFLLIGLFQVYVSMTAVFFTSMCSIDMKCPPVPTFGDKLYWAVYGNQIYFIISAVLFLVGIILYKTRGKSVWKKMYDSV